MDGTSVIPDNKARGCFWSRVCVPAAFRAAVCICSVGGDLDAQVNSVRQPRRGNILTQQTRRDGRAPAGRGRVDYFVGGIKPPPPSLDQIIFLKKIH